MAAAHKHCPSGAPAQKKWPQQGTCCPGYQPGQIGETAGCTGRGGPATRKCPDEGAASTTFPSLQYRQQPSRRPAGSGPQNTSRPSAIHPQAGESVATTPSWPKHPRPAPTTPRPPLLRCPSAVPPANQPPESTPCRAHSQTGPWPRTPTTPPSTTDRGQCPQSRPHSEPSQRQLQGKQTKMSAPAPRKEQQNPPSPEHPGALKGSVPPVAGGHPRTGTPEAAVTKEFPSRNFTTGRMPVPQTTTGPPACPLPREASTRHLKKMLHGPGPGSPPATAQQTDCDRQGWQRRAIAPTPPPDD